MQPSLRDLAKHLKGLLPLEIPETYTINPMFEKIADTESIRKGVRVFREFLYQFFDCIIADTDLYDKPKKDFDKIVYTVNFAMEYPFLRNLAVALIHIGIHGELNKSGDVLALSGNQLHMALKGAKVSKAHEYLQYLTNCGICFSGIDLEEKRPDLSKVETLEISYPDDNRMLIGLKVMAIAQMESYKKRYKPETGSYNADVDSIFLRCDFRALGEESVKPVLILEDYISSFSEEVQKNILNLHKRYVDEKFKCVPGIVNLINRFEYIYQGANIWTISITPLNGYAIKIYANHIRDYAESFGKRYPYFIEIVENSADCKKKSDLKSTCRGCCGSMYSINDKEYLKCKSLNYYIPLSDFTDDNNQMVQNWIDTEISIRKSKKIHHR